MIKKPGQSLSVTNIFTFDCMRYSKSFHKNIKKRNYCNLFQQKNNKIYYLQGIFCGSELRLQVVTIWNRTVSVLN